MEICKNYQKSDNVRGRRSRAPNLNFFKKNICVLNVFPFLINVANANVANVNVANAPLRVAKVELKACLYILTEDAWEGEI